MEKRISAANNRFKKLRAKWFYPFPLFLFNLVRADENLASNTATFQTCKTLQATLKTNRQLWNKH
ncbi:hypothetical protein [Pedobacter segetis]|uniref:hypothetical protein n=1 Tax=Pedobacter segetis TaxID=2793069 RepID=UPI00190C4C3F|nr:hypothetical protein [Pedobacter segetis]